MLQESKRRKDLCMKGLKPAHRLRTTKGLLVWTKWAGCPGQGPILNGAQAHISWQLSFNHAGTHMGLQWAHISLAYPDSPSKGLFCATSP